MVLEAAILMRGLRAKLISRFPLFYSYLLVVLIEDIIRYIAFLLWYPQRTYSNIYWATQFVSVVMGSLVIFEVSRLALQEYPGTARMARNLLGAMFLVIFAKTLLTMNAGAAAWMIQVYVRLERELRLVEAFAILTLLVVFLWYAVPMGRNLGAILLGYGTFIAMSVMQLTIVNHFELRAQHFWSIAQPVTYTAILGLWVWKLWSPDTAAMKSPRRIPGSDYEELASSTSRSLEEARTRLGSAVRP